MKQVWIATVLFAAALGELQAGMVGLGVPLVGVCAFYLTVVFGWQATLLPLAVTAACLDVAWGRQGPLSVCLILPMVLLARFWRNHGDCRHGAAQVVPGLIAGGLLLGMGLVVRLLQPGAWHGGEPMPELARYVGMVLGAGAGLPLVCAGLDWLAAGLGLPRYADIQQRDGLAHDA